MRFVAVLYATVVLACAACAAAQTTSSDDDPLRVADQFIAAREAHDLDATMASFGDAPELRSSQGINWSGRDAVRAIMTYRLQDTYTVGDRHVSGDRVTWSEHVVRTVSPGGPPANFDEDVEVTVVGGHIQSLVTYLGGRRTPDLPTRAAESSSLTSSTMPWVLPISLGLLVFAALIWPTSGHNEPRRQTSGQMLDALRRYAESHGTQSSEDRR